MSNVYRHKETGNLYNRHELLTFSMNNNGPSFDPDRITTEIQDLLNVEYVYDEPFNRQLQIYEFIYDVEIVQEDGKWIRRKVTAFADDEGKARMDELAATEGRAIRDRKLQETDWTQLSDAPSGSAAKYNTYRQQLRDITTASGWPHTHTWPTKPE